MGIIPQKLFDRIAAKLGYVRGQKSWSSDWLAIREFNLSQGGNKIVKPYAEHSDVYKAIRAIGDNVGQAEFKFMKGDNEAAPSALNKLFLTPNPLMSRSQLWEATAIYLSLRGNCFWILNKSRGQISGTSSLPAEIWVFNPDYFSPRKDNAGNLLAWSYRNSIEFLPEEIIHFKYFNPYDPIMGLSPLDPISKTVNLDYSSLIYNSKFFENNAEPGYVLSTEKELSEEQFSRLKAQWDSNHKGVDKAHKLAILEGGLKPANIGTTHKDMEFVEQRRLNREDIMGIWRVPKSMFSITDDLNYATFQGQKKLFWTDTIMPMLRYVEETLNAHFFAKISPGITGKFDFSNVISLQEDMNDKLDRATKLFAMGVPFNTINDELGLGFEKIEGGDIGYLPFNLVPAGSDFARSANSAATQEPVKPAPEQPKNQDAPSPEVPPVKSTKQIDRQAVSKRFISLQDPLEKRYEAIIKDYFYRQRAKVLALIGAQKSIKIYYNININWQDQNQELIKISNPLFTEASKSGAQFADSLLDGAIDFNLLNPNLTSVVHSRFLSLPEINDTIREELQAQLMEGATAGETTEQIAERIRSVYNFASNRSKIIARTEITGAMNGGTMVAFKQAGVTKKQWTTSHDDIVRESHQAIDGEIVGIDQVFSNGVDYPAGNGPAGEVINCRCNPTPVFD